MEAYYFQITKVAFYLYVLMLVTAGLCDIWRFIIPNLVSLFLVLMFFVVALISPFPVDWLSHLAAMAGFFAIGFLLYVFKVLGAGDVKLITAVSLWVGLDKLMDFLLVVAVAGGALSLVLLALRFLLPPILVMAKLEETIKLPRVLLPGSPVPYGVGIAVGGLWLAGSLPLLGYLSF